MDTNEALAAATSADTHGAVLHSLRKHESAAVREAVAKNPNAYPDTLRILANDSDINVLYGVANNLSAYRLHRFIADTNGRKLLEAGESLSAQ